MLDLYRNLEYKASMKKEKPTMEEFAAKIAAKEDNPTMHELVKSFPEKTYKELEQYRNADRHEEASQIPLTEAQQNLVDHIESAVEKSKVRLGTCITAKMRKDREEIDWKEKYNKEHKLRQEAEGETTIVKGIGINSPEMKRLTSEVEALKQQLYVDKKEAEESLANALEINESHQRLNGKLQVRIAELEDENKKMHKHLDKQVEDARKAGL